MKQKEREQRGKQGGGERAAKGEVEPRRAAPEHGSQPAGSGDVPAAISPFSFMRRFSEEMDRAFDEWFGGGALGGGRAGGLMFRPQLEVCQEDGELVICADLPGLEKDDVTVEVENDVLVVRGERRQEHESRESGVWRSERSYGSFSRAVPLPEGADVEHARAEFRNGVLEIRIPVPEHAGQSRRIPIGGETRSGGRSEGGQEREPRQEQRKAG